MMHCAGMALSSLLLLFRFWYILRVRLLYIFCFWRDCLRMRELAGHIGAQKSTVEEV